MQMSKVWFVGVRRLSSETAALVGRAAASEAELVLPASADEDEMANAEAEVLRARDKSGLKPHHLRMYRGQVAYPEAQHRAHLTLDYQRRALARCGLASGVDPALCWMPREQLRDVREYEALAHPYTVQQMVKIVQDQRASERLAVKQREDTIRANLAKMEKMKEDMQKRVEKKLAEANAIKAKKDRLVEEVRRHFGFKVDSKDQRFKLMLEEREKEQLKAEKLAKRQAREAQYLLKLQQKNAVIS